jgi:hypothetical protein
MRIPRAAALAAVGLVLIAAVLVITRSGGSDPQSNASTAPAPPAAGADPSTSSLATVAKDAGRPPSSRRAKRDGGPAVLDRALSAGDTALLLFHQPGAADDRATRKRLRQLERSLPSVARRRVAVLFAPISDLGDYGSALGELRISQAPAIVVVSRGREARVLEGFTDKASLRQHLVDASR